MGQLLAQVLYQALVGDAVLIVALGGLGGGGEDGLFQLLGQLVIAGDNLAAEGLACLVGLPHGAEHVAPDDELVGQHFQLLHQHHTVFVFLFGKFLRHILGVGGNQVVLHNVLRQIEPEQGELVEHPALFRHGGGQNDVKGRDAVCGVDDQFLVGDLVNLPHLAASNFLHVYLPFFV